jgi:hypothetical protein
MTHQKRPALTIVCENYWPEVASTEQLVTVLAEDLSASFDVEVMRHSRVTQRGLSVAGEQNALECPPSWQRQFRVAD